MANYYNPMYNPYGMNSFQQPQQTSHWMEYVDGEVGAKAFQMPAGLPANTPIALWDSTPNSNKVFFKSWNQLGRANPILWSTYSDPAEMKEMQNITSGETREFVTKQDLEDLKKELKSMMAQNKNRGEQR